MIPALAGLIGVGIGALKPIWEWQIEAKRLRYNERKLFIKRLRDIITSPKFKPYYFVYTSEYTQLRPYMPEQIIRKYEYDEFVDPIVAKGENVRTTDHILELLDLVRDLEIQWGLL